MKKTKAILLVVGLFIFFVALNFLFFVDKRGDEENEVNGDRSSYRSTPYGTLAFYTLLEESHYDVTRFEKPFTELRDHEPGTLIVIAPPPAHNPEPEEFAAVTRWVEQGGLLLIIDREINLNLGEAAIRTQSGDRNVSIHSLQPTLFTDNVRSVHLSDLATRVKVDSRSATYHLGDDKAAILADTTFGKGRVVMLTDQYVVANNGISQADNVILAMNLLNQRPSGKIAFDEYHHGYGSSAAGGGLMAYFRGTPFPWMMAQAGLIALLVVYSRGRRFGRPIPLRVERRTTNLEFVSSMANITRLAQASDLAMENIYSEFRKRLCRYSGLPTRADSRLLASTAARRSRLNESELISLLVRCENIVRGDPVSEPELLKLVRRIREIETYINR